MFRPFRRSTRKIIRRSKNWGTIVKLTLSGNEIEKRSQLQNAKDPVLLIYGFGATRRTFSILEKRLHKDGYTVFSINLGGIFDTFNTDAIECLASKIDEKIEKVYRKYKIKGKLSIICHSKGGLIGHYYVKRLGGDKRTKTLITLGTPHNGNPWALFAAFTPIVLLLKSVRQMAPMSHFIKRLKMGKFPKKVMFYSIYSKDDRVCPYPCSVLEEEGPHIKNIEIDGLSHSEFLIKKSAYHAIKHAIDGQMPKSWEDRSREKYQKRDKSQKPVKLRLIEGAKSLAFK